MEEDIEVIQEYIEYDKEHRLVTVFDKKPLFRDRLENLLTKYKQLEKENENLKQAIKINQDLYETKCNENKELTDKGRREIV